jgi:hypothetical protein
MADGAAARRRQANPQTSYLVGADYLCGGMDTEAVLALPAAAHGSPVLEISRRKKATIPLTELEDVGQRFSKAPHLWR